MQTFPQQFLCIPSHARCAHRFLSSGTQQSYKQIKKIRKPLILKVSLKKIERVMGIEPTYPAWKAGVLPLNYTRISVGVTGFEPATSWSQTRRSSQAEPHPVNKVSRFAFNPFALDARFIILHCFRFVNTFFHFFQNVFCVVLFSPDSKEILSYLFSSVNT